MEERKRRYQELLEKRRSEMENKVKSSVEPQQTSYELFGIECGKGWESLYRPIMTHIDELNKTLDEKIEVSQIKEKFGGLRIYLTRYTEELREMIADAEDKSYNMCENCGKEAKRRNRNGWIYTMCDECYDEMNKRKEKALLEFQNKIREMKENKEREKSSSEP